MLVLGLSTALMASVPEIDPASGGTALALLGGVVLMLRGRRSK